MLGRQRSGGCIGKAVVGLVLNIRTWTSGSLSGSLPRPTPPPACHVLARYLGVVAVCFQSIQRGAVWQTAKVARKVYCARWGPRG